MKFKFFFIIVFGSFLAVGQEQFSKEFSFITDNDLYVSVIRDRYYTSGIFLSYRYLSKTKKEPTEKKIFDWQISHKMYTPFRATVTDINEHDRPFAGHLYGSFGVHTFFKSESIISTTLQFGIIGPNAYAKELQNFIHSIYGFKKGEGWKHQIKNALAINFNFNYTKFLVKNEANRLDLTWVNSAKIGTVHTNIATGLYSRIGFKPLQSIANSIGFKSNLNNKENCFFKEVESFLYINPTLRYTLYDATIQGSFLNTKSDVTKEIIPFVFNIEVGYLFTVNRFNLGYVFNYNTSKTKDLRFTKGNRYGSIIINYLLR